MNMNQYQIFISRALPGLTLDDREHYAEKLCSHAARADEIAHNHANNGEYEPGSMKLELMGALHHLSGLALMYGLTLEELATDDLEYIRLGARSK